MLSFHAKKVFGNFASWNSKLPNNKPLKSVKSM